MQIGDFKRQLRIGPKMVSTRRRILEQQLFADLQYAMEADSSGGSWGGSNYDLSFKTYPSSGPPNAGRITKRKDLESLEVSDPTEQLSLTVADTFTTIWLRTATGLLSLSQTTEPAQCTLVFLDPMQSEVYRGATYVSMIENVPADVWTDTRELLAKHGVGGLDVFAPEIVDDIAKRLDGELPEVVKIENAKTQIETIVFPLLNDAQYLQAIQDQVPASVLKPLKKRVIQLRRSSK